MFECQKIDYDTKFPFRCAKKLNFAIYQIYKYPVKLRLAFVTAVFCLPISCACKTFHTIQECMDKIIPRAPKSMILPGGREKLKWKIGGKKKIMGFAIRKLWFQNLALPIPIFVKLAKVFNLSES